MNFKPKPILLAAVIATSIGTFANAANSAPADCSAQTAAGQPCPPGEITTPADAPAAKPPAAAVAPTTPPAAVATPPAAQTPAAQAPAAQAPAGNQRPAVEGRQRRDQASNFQFDPDRHNRRRARNDLFRFFFNGYYYDRPYWQNGYYEPRSSRISCAEGRRIIADEDFSRIRTIECNGTSYTYQARRGSNTYRLLVSSTRGTILSTRRVY
jgi:hypothetical protein